MLKFRILTLNLTRNINHFQKRKFISGYDNLISYDKYEKDVKLNDPGSNYSILKELEKDIVHGRSALTNKVLGYAIENNNHLLVERISNLTFDVDGNLLFQQYEKTDNKNILESLDKLKTRISRSAPYYFWKYGFDRNLFLFGLKRQLLRNTTGFNVVQVFIGIILRGLIFVSLISLLLYCYFDISFIKVFKILFPIIIFIMLHR